jgi:hypothetical protein
MKKPTIKQIQVDKEKLEQLKTMLSSDKLTPYQKRNTQKKLVGECCICGRIPSKIIIQDVGDAKLIEKYCEACYA